MNEYCFQVADIYLPAREEIEKGMWAVIACDQFTSEVNYWEDVERQVGSAPSTLRLMLPEVYLKEAETRLPIIHQAMRDAVKDVLLLHPHAMIAVERTQTDGKVRHGIVGQIDLEAYDYTHGAQSLIRATEGTVLSRIPPRVAIRRGASLELPHVMLLIDDPEKTVIEPLFMHRRTADVAYDTDLLAGGGHIRGTFLNEKEISGVQSALSALKTPEKMAARYGERDIAPLLFAVGDGNHSLASAKAAYEEIKASIGEEAARNHPARYALVEVVNLHDSALSFEPIYRVLFHVDPQEVLAALRKYAADLQGNEARQTLHAVSVQGEEDILFAHPEKQLTVGTLQAFLDDYLTSHPDAVLDYIHDEASLRTLAAGDGALGFLFAGMEKSQLFRTVIYDGALPRKTFSMGHARDKRYYMECRAIQ